MLILKCDPLEKLRCQSDGMLYLMLTKISEISTSFFNPVEWNLRVSAWFFQVCKQNPGGHTITMPFLTRVRIQLERPQSRFLRLEFINII